MNLKIMLPYKTVLDESVYRVSAPGVDGEFQILPRHIDGTWILKAGVLVVSDEERLNELYFAISEGVLVKEGQTVYLSCFQAIQGESLENLMKTVREDLEVIDEEEEKARQALIKLETDAVKRFIDFER